MPRRSASGVRIRQATLQDLDVLVRQRRGMWRDISDHTEAQLDAADREYLRWARPRLKSGTLVGFLAETREGRVVAGGCVWLQEIQPMPGRPDREQPYLLSMYTEPEYRGRGLATRIVRETIRWARARGYFRITLHASELGRSLYRKQGFTRSWEMRFRVQPRPRGRATPRGPRRSSAASRRRGARGTRAAR